MSMTMEEIIKKYEVAVEGGKQIAPLMGEDAKEIYEMLKAGLSALRPITREQVKKVWKGCPECKPRCGLCAHIFEWDKYGKPHVCESCVDFSNFESDQKFCEVCGAPMTDEAVQMVMGRLEALRDEKG